MGSRLHYWGILGTILLVCGWAFKLHAGGSGLNTVVIINQASSNSCELGNYYCQQRQIPPQNVLYINWTGTNTLWASNDLQTSLVTPLLNMLTSRALTNQIYYVVLSMDIPFQTSDGTTVNGTTSALFYGLRLGNGTDPLGMTNSYACSEGIFGQTTPVGSPGYSFLTTMITGNSLTEAERLVDQGVASDGTFPQQPVVLDKTSDTARNIRYIYFDNAIFNVNLLGVSTIMRTNSDSVWWPGTCGGYETGLANYSVPPGLLVPGSIADSLTSYGGIIFGNSGQTSLLAFTTNGAAGSYGTVAEPLADTQKFPNPLVYFFQARGFSLAESYYQSLNVPYLGLIAGEPLAAPFARPGNGQWSTNLVNAVLSGTTNLSVQFTAHDSKRPLQQIDLFVDGVYFSTLTNLVPCPGNQLTANLNGYPVTYTVPTNATLSTIATGLAVRINAATNATQIKATAYGDRVQLQSLATNPAAAPFYVDDNTPTNTPGLVYSASYLPDSFPPQMTPGLPNKNGAFTMQVGIPTTQTYYILASTNLTTWEPIYTNTVAGLLNFTDPGSTNYPERFYQISWTIPNQPPQLSPPVKAGAGAVQMQVTSIPGQPCAVQVTTDLVHWVSIFTNQLGGTTNFVDTGAVNLSGRYYRAFLADPPPPAFTLLHMATNLTLIRVNSAMLPYTVEVSTNQSQWTLLTTNFAFGQVQTTVASTAGSGNNLSTFLNAVQPAFMPSQAYGFQGYEVLSNKPSTSAWIQFTFTKTNGQVVVVGVTNQLGTNSVALASQLCNAINTNAALQGSDGVMVGDFIVNATWATFNVYARSPGGQAAQILAQPQTYAILMTTPQGTLTQNLSDLEPRNHLYVTAGASRIALTFPLASTNFPDGYHTLTAVAYEGSNVRTETQVSVPVQIQNTPLSATMTLLDLTNAAPSEGTYHIKVTANTNNVSQITLYSTGGALGTASNSSIAVFTVAGTNLWAGLHPFYAIVQTASGLAYRTRTQSVTLSP